MDEHDFVSLQGLAVLLLIGVLTGLVESLWPSLEVFSTQLNSSWPVLIVQAKSDEI